MMLKIAKEKIALITVLLISTLINVYTPLSIFIIDKIGVSPVHGYMKLLLAVIIFLITVSFIILNSRSIRKELSSPLARFILLYIVYNLLFLVLGGNLVEVSQKVDGLPKRLQLVH